MLSGVMIGPRVGIVVLTCSIVLGQALGSMAVDSMGWFNQPIRPISVGRIAGVIVVFVGLIIVLRSSYREAGG